jgi:DNA-binding NtrC family response regulator
LIESELFGHEKGSFTGAVRRKLGKFEIAKGGTIFLDEVGTITPPAQVTFLQVLQEGIFQRVGGEETIEANVRVIAASNADLKKMCDEGCFRRDLYYRLNVFPIEIPPLRERGSDIPQLVEIFLKRLNRFNNKAIHDVDPRVVEALIHYPWPGNIRELENVIERAYILERTSSLGPDSFPADLFDASPSSVDFSGGDILPLAEVRRQGVEELEKRYLMDLLAKNKGRINDSAGLAGITTRQLHKLMTKYGIRKEDFKA